MDKFVLEIIDDCTECVYKTIIFEAERSKLFEIINPEISVLENWEAYELDFENIKEISRTFNIKIIVECHSTIRIRNFNLRDELPYKIHTNSELLLMLKGRKPFAVFTDYYIKKTNMNFTQRNFSNHM